MGERGPRTKRRLERSVRKIVEKTPLGKSLTTGGRRKGSVECKRPYRPGKGVYSGYVTSTREGKKLEVGLGIGTEI